MDLSPRRCHEAREAAHQHRNVAQDLAVHRLELLINVEIVPEEGTHSVVELDGARRGQLAETHIFCLCKERIGEERGFGTDSALFDVLKHI